MRASHGTYADPLDLLWIEVARRLGLAVVCDPMVNASYDGAGRLGLLPRTDFDPDDSVAQLIFHELCHALVQGPEALLLADWGLDNTTDRDLLQEHACHRLQAALLDRYGLRPLMAVTTEHRPYWDALPAAPLADGPDPALPAARGGWTRATQGPWAGTLDQALRDTAAIAQILRAWAPEGSLWSLAQDRDAEAGAGPAC